MYVSIAIPTVLSKQNNVDRWSQYLPSKLYNSDFDARTPINIEWRSGRQCFHMQLQAMVLLVKDIAPE